MGTRATCSVQCARFALRPLGVPTKYFIFVCGGWCRGCGRPCGGDGCGGRCGTVCRRCRFPSVFPLAPLFRVFALLVSCLCRCFVFPLPFRCLPFVVCFGGVAQGFVDSPLLRYVFFGCLVVLRPLRAHRPSCFVAAAGAQLSCIEALGAHTYGLVGPHLRLPIAVPLSFLCPCCVLGGGGCGGGCGCRCSAVLRRWRRVCPQQGTKLKRS